MTGMGDPRNRHWYFFGAGLTLWSSWQVSTAIGIFIGAQIPASWPLDFVLPLTFIALVVPAIKDRAGLAAALVAGLIGLLAVNFLYKTGAPGGGLDRDCYGIGHRRAAEMNLWLVMIIAGLLTFATRLSFILLLDRIQGAGLVPADCVTCR